MTDYNQLYGAAQSALAALKQVQRQGDALTTLLVKVAIADLEAQGVEAPDERGVALNYFLARYPTKGTP